MISPHLRSHAQHGVSKGEGDSVLWLLHPASSFRDAILADRLLQNECLRENACGTSQLTLSTFNARSALGT